MRISDWSSDVCSSDLLLVRTIARKGYRFVAEVRESVASERAEPAMLHEPLAQALALPDRPSIAALPFLNLSGDPTQDYFVDGVVEDVIAALSRMRRSEEHTSELQSLMRISYDVFCLKKKNHQQIIQNIT